MTGSEFLDHNSRFNSIRRFRNSKLISFFFLAVLPILVHFDQFQQSQNRCFSPMKTVWRTLKQSRNIYATRWNRSCDLEILSFAQFLFRSVFAHFWCMFDQFQSQNRCFSPMNRVWRTFKLSKNINATIPTRSRYLEILNVCSIFVSGRVCPFLVRFDQFQGQNRCFSPMKRFWRTFKHSRNMLPTGWIRCHHFKILRLGTILVCGGFYQFWRILTRIQDKIAVARQRK